mmetsp:Transcript_14915/g.39447  ORF Transcript_14915/g.39447 Transcript_14915/m.39447 type:complete len:324 (+) Transcript_14915:262-1233(+)
MQWKQAASRNRLPASSPHSLAPGKEGHPMLPLGLCGAPDAACEAPKLAGPHLRVAEAHLQPVEARVAWKVAESDRRGGERTALVAVEGVEVYVPPAEGAALLHPPLQLHPGTRLQALEARKHAVHVQARARARNRAHLQCVTDGGWAAPEAVPLTLWNVLWRDLAGAHVLRRVASSVRIEGDPGWHGGHREAWLLLAVEDLEKHLCLASEGVLVQPFPLLGALVVKKVVEGRPPLLVHVVPQCATRLLQVDGHGLGGPCQCLQLWGRPAREGRDVKERQRTATDETSLGVGHGRHSDMLVESVLLKSLMCNTDSRQEPAESVC